MHIKTYSYILFYALLFTACSTRKVVKSELFQADSLRHSTRLVVRSQPVPESRAMLGIPVAELQQLPSGAVFLSKSGQATASVRFVRDTLFVTATCDSLQQLVYAYEEQIEQLARVSEQKEVIRRTPYRTSFFIWGGICVGIILIIFKLFQRQRLNQ